MSDFPFFRRHLRPHPVFWLASIAAAPLLLSCLDLNFMESGRRVQLVMMLTSMAAFLFSSLAFDSEVEEGTLEQLAALPVPSWRIALEVGSASGIRAFVLALPLLFTMSLLAPFDASSLRILPAGAALALSCGWKGALSSRRHALGLRAWVCVASTLLFVASMETAWAGGQYQSIVPTGHGRPLPLASELLEADPAWLMGCLPAAILAVGALTWAAAWAFTGWAGGGWCADDPPARSVRPARPDYRGIPDGRDPLFWHELWRTEWRYTLAVGVFGALSLLNEGPQTSFDEGGLLLAFWLGILGFVRLSLRAGVARQADLATHLALTPLAPRSIPGRLILATGLRMALVAVLWLAGACIGILVF